MKYATYKTFKRLNLILINFEKVSAVTDVEGDDDNTKGCYIRLDNGNDIRVLESFTEVTEDFKDYLDTLR